MNDRDSFDFNTLSSGYAAVLDIVVDLIIRMESQSDRKFDFSVAGIVLIDEIETHLHLELQRKILDLLTSIFPNIQFILSTHSPFIINSVDNAVIYDLEKNLLVENGLSDVPLCWNCRRLFLIQMKCQCCCRKNSIVIKNW